MDRDIIEAKFESLRRSPTCCARHNTARLPSTVVRRLRMTTRTLRAMLLLLLPTLFFLTQCKQKDSTPPVPKVLNAPTTPEHPPNVPEASSKQAPSTN